MNAGEDGLGRLKDVIAEVAASLPPARRRGVRVVRHLAWAGAAAALILAAAFGGVRLLHTHRSSRPPVEVLLLRVAGEDAEVEVIDSAGTGSIVVVARPAAGKEAGVKGGAR